MTSTFTGNKYLEEPANGDYVNLWNIPNNNNFTVIDAALGRQATVTVTGVSTTQTLNAVVGSPITNGAITIGIFQYQCQTLIFTGTLGVNLTYLIPSGVSGMWNIYNATSGAYTLTIASAGSVAGGVTIPQGSRAQILCDGGVSYGVALSSTTNSPAGVTGSVQYNNGGVLAGGSTLTTDGKTLVMNSSFMRNRIINGAMQIAQRGTSFTSVNGYTLDRWAVFSAGTFVNAAQISGPAGFSYALQITGVTGNTQAQCLQRIESYNIADLAGTTVTLSVTMQASSPQTVGWTAYYPTSADNYTGSTLITSGTFSVTTSATQFTTQISLPSNVANGLQISFSPNNFGAFTSGTLTITGVQLEAGSVATPFEFKSVGDTLVLCQRYFADVAFSGSSPAYQIGGYSGVIGNVTGPALVLPVTMRALPTLATRNITYSNGAGLTVTTLSAQTVSNYFSWSAIGNSYVTFNLAANAEI